MSERARAVASFRQSTLPAMSYRGLSSEACGVLRSLAAAQKFIHFDLAPRGRFELCDAALDEALEDELASIVAACAASAVKLVAHRWTRLVRGDYALCLDDEHWMKSLPGSEVYELTLDVSGAASGEAEVVYTHRGQAFFSVEQAPGQLAVVYRGPTVARYDRYLTQRVGDLTVLRLRASYAVRE